MAGRSSAFDAEVAHHPHVFVLEEKPPHAISRETA
jgi:hypothetical protein